MPQDDKIKNLTHPIADAAGWQIKGPPVFVHNDDDAVLPLLVEEMSWLPFRDHAKAVGAGDPISGIESAGAGKRVRYSGGSIYVRPDGGAAWVYGAIGERYDQLGAATSWLGLPLSDEQPFPESGRAVDFERGAIYWWADVGPIDLNDVAVQYAGLYCFGEADWDTPLTSSDQPYVTLGVVAPGASLDTTRSQIYQDVDAGDSRPDLLELYRGKPYGIAIPMILAEHGSDDPEKYRELVKGAVTAGEQKLAPAVSAAVAKVPVVGPILALAVEFVLPLLIPIVTSVIGGVLGTSDRELGAEVVQLSAKQMVVLAARTPNTNLWGISYKVESPLMSHYGATYKVYLGLSAV